MNKASDIKTSGLPPLVLIAGPTASGKSALAMALAELIPSVIINADSMQVYRDLRVVTARPHASDERRHPHQLFGHIDGAEPYSTARWASEAKTAIAETHAVGRLPIIVGGTGLYLRTLIDGIAPVPAIDPAIRHAVRMMPVATAYHALLREDPVAAAHLAPGDTARVGRALEVIRSTGKPLSLWQARREGGLASAVRLCTSVLLPPRDWLVAQCDTRFDAIFNAGQDEVATLAKRRLDVTLPVMRAIGVREISDFQAGVITTNEALAAGKLATRQYAKRQYTWFGRQSPASWERLNCLLDINTVNDYATKLHNIVLTG